MGAPSGRGREFGALAEGLAAAADGRLWVGVVSGEAGIGKSTLIQGVAEHARATGVDVLVGGASELDRARPFAPLADALGLGGVEDDAPGDFEGALAALEAAASRGPTLLVLDDLHWADTASIGFVRDLPRRLADVPLAVVVSRRTGTGPAMLDDTVLDLVRNGATKVDLGPLDDDVVHALAAEVLGASIGPRLHGALAVAAGNPLHVVELVAALHGEGVVQPTDEGTDVVDLDPTVLVLPGELRQTLLRRTAGLTTTTLEVVRVASVLGTTFHPTELALVLGRSVVTLLGDLHDAIAAGVVHDAGEQLAFRHDLARDALYLGIADDLRAALHREVFRVLTVAGAPAHRRVPHLARGVVDVDGCDELLAVGRDLADRAPELATMVLERALEVLPHDDPRRDDAIAALLVPLVRQGRAGEAAALAAEVLGRPHDPALDGALVEGQTFAVLRSDTPLAHRAEVEASVDLPGLDDDARHRVRAFLAEACLMTGDAEGAADIGEDVRRWAVDAGDEEVLVYVLGTLAWAADGLGHIDRGLALAGEAAARRHALDAPRFNVDIHLGVLHLEADEIDQANLRLREGLRHDLGRGDRAAIAYYHFGLAGVGLMAGTWDDAQAEAEAGLALVDEGTAPSNVSMLGQGILARLAVHRGDVATAQALLRRAEHDLATRGPQVGADLLLWSRALLSEAEGEVTSAAVLLGFEWDAMAGMRYFLSWRSIAPDLVRIALAAGDAARGAQVAADAEEGARRAVGIHSAAAAARRCRGLVDDDADTLNDAIALYRKSPRVVDLAGALEDAGRTLAAQGRRDEAVDLLRESLERFDALGAIHDANRVAARLRAIGVRQPRRPRRAESGWDSLTPTEVRVVELVAAGLTNRDVADQLFVSRYTVETHLKHVFAKLGVSSRIELARQFRARD